MGSLKAAAAIALLATGIATRAPEPPQAPARERLCFVDEGPKDPSFVEFRDSLRNVVAARDVARLMGMLADDIGFEIYDRAGGIRRFVETFRPNDPKGKIWRDLEDVLNVGGGAFIEPDVFCAPYVRCPGPRHIEDIDPELSLVILGDRVPAFAEPSTKSRVVEWLSCDVLPYDGDDLPPRPDDASPGFVPVFLGKQWGFVQEDRTRMLGDWYFHATKRGGRWLLTTILAG